MLYKKGSIFNVTEGIILHGCNAQGVMGSGVAKTFKEKFPEAYLFYIEEYTRGDLKLGWISEYRWSDELLLMSAVTQEFYGRNPNIQYVDYDAIESIFREVKHTRSGWPVHIPKLGAGYGNGNWDVIESIIDANHDNVTCWEL